LGKRMFSKKLKYATNYIKRGVIFL